MSLIVNNLTVSLGAIEVLKDISLMVVPGEIVAIIGESGAGKTSLALSIMGLYPKAKITGQILFHGRKMAMMFQDPMSCLNPTMKIGHQIREGFILDGMTKKEALNNTMELLEELGISNPSLRYHQYPHELSGGMRQRVLLGIALSLEPSLLIADEWSTALDPETEADILTLLKKRAEHMSLLLISHKLPLIEQIATRVVVMHQGKIIEVS